jgi:hypothetical protein
MWIPRFVITAAVLLAAATPARGLIIRNGEVYTVDATTNTSPQEFNRIVVGEGSEGTLNVRDGRLVRSTSSVWIGFTASMLGTGIGYVNILGNHSTLVAETSLQLGVNTGNFFGLTSVGTLNIGAGSLVRALSIKVGDGAVPPSEGTVTIDGFGALLESAEGVSLNARNSVAAMTIGRGATLTVGTAITVTGSGMRIDMEGGRLSLPGPGGLPPAGVVRFNGGSFRFRSAQTLDGGAGFYTNTYGSPPVLDAADPGLIIDGTTTLAAPLALAGGSLRTARIAVVPAAGSLLLAGGTLTLTGEGAVLDDGSDFGPDPLTVGDGAGDPARLVLRSRETVLLGDVTVLADGVLSFAGETLVLRALDNAGSVTVVGAALRAPGGLVNNGSLRLIDAVIDADVISPAGSTIDIAGTVVFNGAFSGGATFHGSGTVIFNPPASGE